MTSPIRTATWCASGRPGRCTPSKALSKGLLLINPRSGDQSPTADELAAAARERGLDVQFLTLEADAGALTREARGPACMGGGDGSLAPVVGAAPDDNKPFVSIPFGTRNHFARD